MAAYIAHVDDDADIRNAVATILKAAGYRVRSFETTLEFMLSLKEEKPDLLLLDVMVERVDSGFTVYDDIRKRLPGIPIILLTSLGDQVDMNFADRTELPWIMEKPILPGKLTAMVADRLHANPE